MHRQLLKARMRSWAALHLLCDWPSGRVARARYGDWHGDVRPRMQIDFYLLCACDWAAAARTIICATHQWHGTQPGVATRRTRAQGTLTTSAASSGYWMSALNSRAASYNRFRIAHKTTHQPTPWAMKARNTAMAAMGVCARICPWKLSCHSVLAWLLPAWLPHSRTCELSFPHECCRPTSHLTMISGHFEIPHVSGRAGSHGTWGTV